MTNVNLSIRGHPYQAQVSFINDDNSNQKYTILLESNDFQLSLSLSEVFATLIDNKIFLKTTSQIDPYMLELNDAKSAKWMFSFITSKSDVHHTNDMIDSLDRTIQGLWPLPSFSYPGFSPTDL